MSHEPGEKKIQGLLRADATKRAEHAFGVIADEGEAWVLTSGDDLALLGPAGNAHVAIWPAEAFARMFVRDGWEGWEPQALSISELKDLLDGLAEEQVSLAVMPVLEGSHLVVPAADFWEEVLEELRQIYDEDEIELLVAGVEIEIVDVRSE